LLWAGVVTLISTIYIWKGNKNTIFLAAIVGDLADLGYFLFLDLGGFVNFMPGTVMTLFSLIAIIASFYAYFKTQNTCFSAQSLTNRKYLSSQYPNRREKM
jgi:hypothetical protein